jgi:hypothetical protein
VYIEGKDLQETMHHAFKGVGVWKQKYVNKICRFVTMIY